MHKEAAWQRILLRFNLETIYLSSSRTILSAFDQKSARMSGENPLPQSRLNLIPVDIPRGQHTQPRNNPFTPPHFPRENTGVKPHPIPRPTDLKIRKAWDYRAEPVVGLEGRVN